MGINIKAYKRTKRQGLREARITEKLEKQQKLEAERKKRQKHQEYLNAVLQHGRELRESHRQNTQKMSKMTKAIAIYHQNAEREKERIRRLMMEDEEGYRKLIDEKKDKRLAYLLSQTDEFIASLTEMVKSHKEDQRVKQKLERKAIRMERKKAMEFNGDGGTEEGGTKHIPVIESTTGRIISGRDAPTSDNIDAFLTHNPSWELLPADDTDTSDDEEEEIEEEGEEGEKKRKEKEEKKKKGEEKKKKKKKKKKK